MISIKITEDIAASQAMVIRVRGQIQRSQALNDRVGRALVTALQKHFLARDKEPNRLGGEKTGFWAGVRAATMIGRISDSGVTIRIGADTFFRIHLLGGTIKPKRVKWLTIPLVAEAHGLTAAEYERDSGKKLFRIGGGRVLMERSDKGDRSTLRGARGSLRTRVGHKTFHLGARARVRPIYALATEATIPRDPRALPPPEELVAIVQKAADMWAKRELKKSGTKSSSS